MALVDARRFQTSGCILDRMDLAFMKDQFPWTHADDRMDLHETGTMEVPYESNPKREWQYCTSVVFFLNMVDCVTATRSISQNLRYQDTKSLSVNNSLRPVRRGKSPKTAYRLEKSRQILFRFGKKQQATSKDAREESPDRCRWIGPEGWTKPSPNFFCCTL